MEHFKGKVELNLDQPHSWKDFSRLLKFLYGLRHGDLKTHWSVEGNWLYLEFSNTTPPTE